MDRVPKLFSSGDSALGRSVVALMVAPPLASYVVGAIWIVALGVADSIEVGRIAAGVLFGSIMITLLGGAIVAYLGMAVVGLPVWLLLRFLNLESAVSYAIAGAWGGALVGHMILVPPLPGDWRRANGALAGMILMLVFWWIARRRRRAPLPM